MENKISILNYGVGNIGSIENMLLKIGFDSEVVSTPEELMKAKKIILPGVGKFDHGMTSLKESGLMDALNKKVLEERVPVIGICLGMQLMFESSEEGTIPGLGWIEGSVKRFDDKDLKVPHIGWNTVQSVKGNSDLEKHLGDQGELRFYFVHSFYVDCPEEYRVFSTEYGHEFVSSAQKENIYACQFHPEKSHRFGKLLLKSFGELPC